MNCSISGQQYQSSASPSSKLIRCSDFVTTVHAQEHVWSLPSARPMVPVPILADVHVNR